MGFVMKAIIMKHVILMVLIAVSLIGLVMDTVMMKIIMIIVTMMVETVVGKMLTHISVMNAFVIIQSQVQNLHCHLAHTTLYLLQQPLQQVRPICFHDINCLLYQSSVMTIFSNYVEKGDKKVEKLFST